MTYYIILRVFGYAVALVLALRAKHYPIALLFAVISFSALNNLVTLDQTEDNSVVKASYVIATMIVIWWYLYQHSHRK